MRYVGTSVRRNEDPRLLTGRGRFVDDLRLPRMVHASFLHSPHAHARIRGVDVEAARRAPGVVAVLTGTDLAALARPLAPVHGGGVRAAAHPALCFDKVRFVGDLVALVIAETRAQGEDALELIEVDYEVLTAVATIDDALSPDAAPIFDEDPGADVPNVVWRGANTWGDVDAAFASADHVVRETFTQHRHTCVPMECRAGLAEYDPASDELTYTMSHQNPHATRMFLSTILDHSAARLTIKVGDVGGSFGLKSHPAREDVAVCAAAKLLHRPVKWVEDRSENLVTAGHARDERIHIEAAVARDGELLGLRAKLELDSGAYPLLNIPLNLVAIIVRALLPGTLRLRHYSFEGTVVTTNKASYVAYRGPWEVECWVRERLIDVIAHELDLDPVAVRRRNYLPDEAFPCTMLTGASLEFMSINHTLDRAVELSGYASFREQQAHARRDGRFLGIGLCTYLEPGPGPPDYGQALGFTYEQRSAQRARVKIEPDGRVSVFTSQQPHGQGHETTLAQIAADELGVPFDHVKVIHGDTRLQPFNMVATGGSRAATLASGAVLGAARSVREQIVAIVADQLEANVSDLRIEDGIVSVAGSPSRQRTIAEIARASYLAPFTLPRAVGTGLDASFDFETPVGGWTQSTHVCFVEVDIATGVVSIPRYVVVEDCGRMINPAVVEGQIRGGIAQGLGAVLYEHAAYDEDANFLASTFMDYLVPTSLEVPEIEIEHLEYEPQGEVAYRGVGEGGAIGAPAALCNAIEDALVPFGVRITEQYLPPSRILELIATIDRVERGTG
ncbi:MAG TPA: xanthine dehydrogenase family protein molybdopterin-binding subunit [Acidimicrobiales bacterium]|nr:xanthine dehydrogenase family protein molybdopterin-binding subunit [Acidimicrobiales bacterium]